MLISKCLATEGDQKLTQVNFTPPKKSLSKENSIIPPSLSIAQIIWENYKLSLSDTGTEAVGWTRDFSP